MATKKTRGLGKGISALIPESQQPEPEIGQASPVMLKTSQIEPNPNQPRKAFDAEKLRLLSDSIKQHGILQPIVVQKNENGLYTIIAGERRWRAARMARISEIPVVVKSLDELAVAEISLIENLQREDLNPVEEAMGYERLISEFNLTQEEISQKLGKSRPAVTNILRILKLSPPVRKLVEQLEISSGHARALLALEDSELQEKTAYEIIEKDWSVRQTENFVKQLLKPKDEDQGSSKKINAAKDYLETSLGEILGTKVKINQGKNKGKIEIEFYDNEGLERIVKLLRKD